MAACPECGGEGFDDGDGGLMCGDCGHDYKAGADQYRNYVVGVVVSVEEVKKKKLKVVSVDIGADEPINVVTSAKHVAVDERVVVALEGARVPSTATQEECEDSDEEDAVIVQAASVGGRKSHGSESRPGLQEPDQSNVARSHSLLRTARPLSHARITHGTARRSQCSATSGCSAGAVRRERAS